MKKVCIIGGGASGLVSAIYAAKNKADVTIIEKNNQVGKKILLTGNGKCNYFNQDNNLKHYHTTNKKILKQIITKDNLNETLNFFDKIGIVPKIKNGYYYPFSNQAISIRENLLYTCQNLNIKIITNTTINKITKKQNKFIINNEKFDKVVIATGSKAYPQIGATENGYTIAQHFGHHLITPLPALCGLISNETNLKNWHGIRCDAKVTLTIEQQTTTEIGEIQLTKDGVSGICIFNLSGKCSQALSQGKKPYITINFLPMTNSFVTFINQRAKKLKNRPINRLFDGLINYKLINFLLEKTKINKTKTWEELTQSDKNKLQNAICNKRLEIIKTKDFNNAQTCTGGIPLNEINPLTMESLKTKNLYITGELLDVDGDCGGYNLTFAWISGMLAGKDLNND